MAYGPFWGGDREFPVDNGRATVTHIPCDIEFFLVVPAFLLLSVCGIAFPVFTRLSPKDSVANGQERI